MLREMGTHKIEITSTLGLMQIDQIPHTKHRNRYLKIVEQK